MHECHDWYLLKAAVHKHFASLSPSLFENMELQLWMFWNEKQPATTVLKYPNSAGKPRTWQHCLRGVLFQCCAISTPCQIITPLLEITIWLPNPNPTPNPNPSPTPNPKPTNTRGVIIWQRSELGTTPARLQRRWIYCCQSPLRCGCLLYFAITD